MDSNEGPCQSTWTREKPQTRIIFLLACYRIRVQLVFYLLAGQLIPQNKNKQEKANSTNWINCTSANPLPLAVTPSSPGVQRHKHHLVRAQSSAHHQSTPRRDKSVGGNMGKTQELPQREDLRSQAGWQGLSCCWRHPGHWKWEDLCIHGHLRAPLAHSAFGQQTHSTGNCCWNYSASLNPVFTVTEALRGEIFLWLQRTPDQTPVILLFLDGEALKLKK